MVKVKSLVGTQGCADVDALVAVQMGFVPIRDSVEYHEASRVAPWDEPTEDNRTFGWQGFLQDPIEEEDTLIAAPMAAGLAAYRAERARLIVRFQSLFPNLSYIDANEMAEATQIA